MFDAATLFYISDLDDAIQIGRNFEREIIEICPDLAEQSLNGAGKRAKSWTDAHPAKRSKQEEPPAFFGHLSNY